MERSSAGWLKPSGICAIIAVINALCVAEARAQVPAEAGRLATLQGRVSAVGGIPLSGAQVRLTPLADGARSRGRSARIGDDGGYRFQAVPPGPYQLRASLDGYQPTMVDLVVRAGATLVLSVVLMPSPVRQDTAAVIAGRVTDATRGHPLFGALVGIEGTEQQVRTDREGRYRLVGVPSGPAILRVQFIGYAPRRVPLFVPARGVVKHNVELAARALMLEGIVVTADALSRARGELATASVIDREAIRHQTATSLRGVLELVPGVPVEAPGLDNVQQISLRSVPTSGSSVGFGELPGGTRAQDLAAFGTLVVVDGVPASNNANLQSLGPRGELGFPSAAAGGIDLRRIPASTLERVEVIRGVPSARWGDFTQGAVIVETRAGEMPLEFRAQHDVRTTQASLVGGRSWGLTHTGTMTFDLASTRSSPGRSDDFAYRLSGQLMHRADLGPRAGARAEPKLRLDTRLDFYQLFDDRPENPNVGKTSASRSRDRGFKLTGRGRLRIKTDTRLSFTGALSTVQQRSVSRAELSRTALPFTDRLAEGREEGHYVIGPYTADVTVDGQPWSVYTRLELGSQAAALGLRHELRTGLELKREWNSGPGRQFDIEFPPQVTFNGVNGFDRPREYRDLPALSTSALYLDDRIRKPLSGNMALEVQAGVRLELLHGGSTWFSGIRDAVIEPRIGAQLQPARWLRVRGGWGRVAKTPSLASIAPDPQFYDVVNVNYYTNDPAERLAVLSTFVRDPTNPNLGFANAMKAEVGVELGIGASAITVVAFDDRITDGVGIRPVPTFLTRDHFALTDSVIGNGIKPNIIEPPERADTVPVLLYRPDHVLTQRNRGLELTAFLPEVPKLRVRLGVSGSWVETRQKSGALYFGNAEDFSDFQLRETDRRTPYWEGATEVGERLLVIYRLIHHQPGAGLVLTATVQHNVTDEFFDIAGTDTLAFEGYLTRDARTVPVPPAERGHIEFTDLRLPRGGLLIEPSAAPGDWMMSVQVSKTLPLDGRLNFWAFNLLDRRGQVDVGPGTLTRPYRAARVGLEVTIPVRAIMPGRVGR